MNLSKEEPKVEKCKLHPKYKGVGKPTSKKKGCTCMKVWHDSNYCKECGMVYYNCLCSHLED